MRCSNSAARLPAKTRWVWASTKPGVMQRLSASMIVASGGICDLRAECEPAAVMRPSSIRSAASLMMARLLSPAPVRGRAGASESDELADVDDSDHIKIRKSYGPYRGKNWNFSVRR